MPASKNKQNNPITEIAEKIYPWLLKMFDGLHDENGMTLQPAHVRAISLNVAQRLAQKQRHHDA